MSRLDEIRARSARGTRDVWPSDYQQAPADLAFLLAEVERLLAEVNRLTTIHAESIHPHGGTAIVTTCSGCQNPFPAWSTAASLKCPDCRVAEARSAQAAAERAVIMTRLYNEALNHERVAALHNDFPVIYGKHQMAASVLRSMADAIIINN